MITVALFAASIVAVSILAWFFRQRFAKYLPSRETMSTIYLVAPIALLLVMAILPDVLLLFVTPQSYATFHPNHHRHRRRSRRHLRRLFEAGRCTEAAPDPLAGTGYWLHRRNGPRVTAR